MEKAQLRNLLIASLTVILPVGSAALSSQALATIKEQSDVLTAARISQIDAGQVIFDQNNIQIAIEDADNTARTVRLKLSNGSEEVISFDSGFTAAGNALGNGVSFDEAVKIEPGQSAELEIPYAGIAALADSIVNVQLFSKEGRRTGEARISLEDAYTAEEAPQETVRFVSELLNESDVLKADIEEMGQQVKTLTADKEALTGEVKELTENLELKAAEITDLNETVEAGEEEKIRLEGELTRSEAENSRLQDQVAAKTEENTALSKESAAKAEENAALTEVVTAKTKENTALTESLTAKARENEELTSLLKEKTLESEDLAKELEAKTTEGEQLAKELKAKTTEGEQLAKELKAKTTEGEQLAKQLEAKTTEGEQLAKQLEAKTTEGEQLAKELEAKTTEGEQLTKELETKTLEGEELTSQLETKTAESENLTKELEAKTLEGEELISQLETKAAENEALAKQLEEKTLEGEQLQKELTQAKADIQELTGQVRGMEAENGRLRLELDPGMMENPEDLLTDTEIEYHDWAAVKAIQISLNDAGFDCGPVDCIYGPKTERGIREYQAAKGLTENGIITEELVESLKKEGLLTASILNHTENDDYYTYLQYSDLSYGSINLVGTRVAVTGKILQNAKAAQEGYAGYLRLAVRGENEDVLFVTYHDDVVSADLEEGGQITVYGRCVGYYTYESKTGEEVEIPWMMGDHIENAAEQ